MGVVYECIATRLIVLIVVVVLVVLSVRYPIDQSFLWGTMVT